jgi:hypothetical protein
VTFFVPQRAQRVDSVDLRAMAAIIAGDADATWDWSSPCP